MLDTTDYAKQSGMAYMLDCVGMGVTKPISSKNKGDGDGVRLRSSMIVREIVRE